MPLFITHFSDINHPLLSSVQRLLQVSDYAVRQIKVLRQLVSDDDCQQQLTANDYQQLVSHLSFDVPAHLFASALRQFRHRQLLRLLLRELSARADTGHTMTAWSDCADALIIRTLDYCKQQLLPRYGVPCHASGEPAQLYVLAMGKLGGRELNFSSDIDLIFSFSASGHTNGGECISNEQYYGKVVQQFVQLFQNITADGFVFRVDLRLRPNGESGPLVCSFAAMETYYQEQGRDWERYAMVKARLIGDCPGPMHAWFDRLITPFVYRRYVDFSVIESLRSMKAMIEREVQLNPLLDDIKRGRGGIREIEFIIQSVQLIRGGRLPHIRQQNAMAALDALKQQGFLARTAALQQAYLFLRKLENALQTQNDQQIHAMPLDGIKQTQIVAAMGFESWGNLVEKLHQYQRIVSHSFHGVLNKTDVYADEKRLLTHQLASLWQGHVETSMAINLLTSLGFQQAERCYQLIHAFRHGPRCRRLTQTARLRLDRFMVLLLGELARTQEKASVIVSASVVCSCELRSKSQITDAETMTEAQATDVVLLQVLRLLENVVGRSAYLALLTENPSVLQELLHWFAHSPFITSLFVTQPFLLEVLIDQEQSWRPLTRKALEQRLQTQLTHCHDNESHDEVLRQFKLTCWLLAARAELYSQCDAVRMGRFLADVAEVLIGEVLAQSCRELSPRYPEITMLKSHFAIIAYGKLGSRDMNYDSDVDLVFLHSATASEEYLVTRLSQKILHTLTTRSQAGVLYSVDTRLRPSGAAGLLVSHIDAFVDYQSTQAWTWEHQALLRARVIFANKRVKSRFHELKQAVLFSLRDKQALRDDVQGMRAKISKYLDGDAIKHTAGGLLDLEFLVQFLILAYPDAHLVRVTNTRIQLKQLRDTNILSQAQFLSLSHAYRHYHRLLHGQLLQPSAIASLTSDKQQAEVLAILREVMQASLS